MRKCIKGGDFVLFYRSLYNSNSKNSHVNTDQIKANAQIKCHLRERGKQTLKVQQRGTTSLDHNSCTKLCFLLLN